MCVKMFSVGIFVIFMIFVAVEASWEEFNIERVVVMNDTEGKIIDFNLRAKRCNRTHYVVTGSCTLNILNMALYDIELKLFHSSKGNNQYYLTPVKVPRKPLCDFANSDYRKLLMVEMHPVSDLPYTEDDDGNICDLFGSQTYELNNYIYNKDAIPQTMDPGTYRAEVLIYKGIDIASGLQLFFKLT